jgi:curved DNA-binding protein
MSALGEYYRVLGVSLDAPAEDIKKAFRKLARTCHPDVAGESPESAEKFGRISEAYETLGNAKRRAEYDRLHERAASRQKKSHIRSEWRPPGGWDGFSEHSKVRASRRSAHQKADITLDDIFSQPEAGRVDFGFGAKRANARAADTDTQADIGLKVDVSGRTARLGGTATVRYKRRRRSSDGVNVYSYDEIYDLRVPPTSCTGDVLRAERMGHFSTATNRYGDLLCTLVTLEETGPHHPRRDAPSQGSQASKSAPARPKPPAAKASDTVRISVVEALLGGRVAVETPKGPVFMGIPPGTSSGGTLRLKGKGEGGADWLVRVEIAVPTALDSESQALIRRFSALNPEDTSKS